MQIIVTHQSIQDTNQCLDDYLKTYKVEAVI